MAERFGAEGFSVALIARNEERLAAGVSTLRAGGITAFAFPADAGDPTSIRAAIKSIRSQMGSITVLHWNAYGGLDVGDLLTADPVALRGVFDVVVFGLLAATDEARSDLKGSDGGAILVSNGGFGEASSEMDEAATNLHAMGIALASAAKDKLAGLLAQRLKGEGIYVGEIMTFGTIKGTPSDNPSSVDPAIIANKFWEMYQSRSQTRATIRQ
jgi:NAD(P)-dependent dehydrogenase (short-subunit alcohol dehydrogenase family)